MQKLTYITIAQPSTHEIPKIKGSRFFWTFFPVETREEAEFHLAHIRKKYHDATHHCSAYRIGLHIHQDLFGTTLIDPKWSKADDDGEPTNTAGKPMLSVLEGNHLHNVLLIVTRYFWWTLLGVGGLIQAYTQTAQETVKNASLLQKEVFEEFTLTFSYEQTSLITYLAEKYEANILERSYDTHVQQKMQINYACAAAFKKELSEKSNGLLTPLFLDLSPSSISQG